MAPKVFRVFRHEIFRQKFKSRRPVFILMIVELAFVVPMLVLFGVARPNLYRTEFWEIGYQMKKNSNPAVVLYAYANHVKQPTLPFVWSYTMTNFNVIISVLSLFILITKLVTVVMRIYFPLLGLVVNIGLTGLYAASIGGQAGPDYMDKRYPSPTPWYIRMSCDVAKPYGAYQHCKLAKATFAITICMLVIYLVNVGVCAWSMITNRKGIKMEDDDENSTSSSPTEQKQFEMKPAGSVGVTPFTPRTQAFHKLGKKLSTSYA